MSERDQFEAWWERVHNNGNPPRFGWQHWRSGDGYLVDDDETEFQWRWEAWQASREALEAEREATVPGLTVWYGSMPESNGKTNWTASLHRKDDPVKGFTIDRSEYPDRVRYEADRMRWLIGELPDEPDILAYDENKRSGYSAPPSHPHPIDTTSQQYETLAKGESR